MIDINVITSQLIPTTNTTSPFLETIANAVGAEYIELENVTIRDVTFAKFGMIHIAGTAYFSWFRHGSTGAYNYLDYLEYDGTNLTEISDINIGQAVGTNLYTFNSTGSTNIPEFLCVKDENSGDFIIQTGCINKGSNTIRNIIARLTLDNGDTIAYFGKISSNGYIGPYEKAFIAGNTSNYISSMMDGNDVIDKFIKVPLLFIKNGEAYFAKNLYLSMTGVGSLKTDNPYFVKEVSSEKRYYTFPIYYGNYGKTTNFPGSIPWLALKEN